LKGNILLAIVLFTPDMSHRRRRTGWDTARTRQILREIDTGNNFIEMALLHDYHERDIEQEEHTMTRNENLSVECVFCYEFLLLCFPFVRK
jgi:hypothetical protein